MKDKGFIRHTTECRIIKKPALVKCWLQAPAIGSGYSFKSCTSAELLSAFPDRANIENRIRPPCKVILGFKSWGVKLFQDLENPCKVISGLRI